jgi:hypothetical protein
MKRIGATTLEYGALAYFFLLLTGALASGCVQDADGDGLADDIDAFPNDASQWSDLDGDGVGDSKDAFPDDESESVDLDGDLAGANSDCDDDDASRSPTLDEVPYDGIDNDCDDTTPDDDQDGDGYRAMVDCDDEDASRYQLLSLYSDADQDGESAAMAAVETCAGAAIPDGWTLTPGDDCDDHNDRVWQVLTGFPDTDGDSFSADPTPEDETDDEVCSGDELPYPYADSGTDCDDADASSYAQYVDLYLDADGDDVADSATPLDLCGDGDPSDDGYLLLDQAPSLLDCDATDSSVFTEYAAFEDLDNDGYTVGTSQVVCAGLAFPEEAWETDKSAEKDCDDGDEDVYQRLELYPDADRDGQSAATAAIDMCIGAEVPNGWTLTAGDDCDDDDDTVWQYLSGFPDQDGDGFGADATPDDEKDDVVCSGLTLPDGYSDDSLDCDDDDSGAYQELSGYVDADEDEVSGTTTTAVLCAGDDLPANYSDTKPSVVDCNDSDASVYPGAADVPYDEVDKDCSATTDADSVEFDADGDGYSAVGAPNGYEGSLGTGDCLDSDADTHPGATDDAGDAFDEDCSGDAYDPHAGQCMPSQAQAMLDDVWAHLEEELTVNLDGISGGSGSHLSNAQLYTNNLLHAADFCDDVVWLDALSEYVLTAYAYLDVASDNGATTWVDGNGNELLQADMSQWLFLNATLVRAIAEIPEDERTSDMQAMLDEAPVLSDAYRRWILDEPKFDVGGWGCNGGINLPSPDGLTLSAQVKTTDTKGQVVLRQSTGYQLHISGGKLAGNLVTDEPNIEAGKAYSIYSLTGATTVSDGEWHHLALVFDGSGGEMGLYVDGVLDGTVETAGDLLQIYTGWVDVGGYLTNPVNFLEATIADVRIYGRALQDNELAEVMVCDDVLSCTSDGLLAYWPLTSDGHDEMGGFPLVAGAATPSSEDVGMVFDGLTDHLRTHDYNDKQTHQWTLRGMANHGLADSPDDPAYCHGLREEDLAFLGGVSELLATRAILDESLGLSAHDAARLLDYLEEGADLVDSRLERYSLTDWGGESVDGLVLDKGYWDTHALREYSGYEGEDFPESADLAVAPSAGFTLVAGGRLVHAFGALHANRWVTGLNFPNDEVMEGLANQFAYASFNGDFDEPLFNNYMSGANGWYGWGNPGAGDGFQPHDLSVGAVTGGYGLWADVNPDIADIRASLYTLITSTDPDVEAFRDDHYGTYWDNSVRMGGMNVDPESSYELLTFLPTFATNEWGP